MHQTANLFRANPAGFEGVSATLDADFSGQNRGRKKPLPRDRGVDGPPRIKKCQPGRPEQFAKIEPNDAAGEQTGFTYNGAGQLQSVTNAKSETTTLVYTAAGYLERVLDPSSTPTEFAYDGYGRIRTVTGLPGRRRKP